MKNQLLNFRVLNAKIVMMILAGLLFSILQPATSSAQTGTIVTGQAFVYKSATNWQDTTGLFGANLYVKFYTLNNANQLIFATSAPINSEGYYSVKVYTTQDLYAIYPGEDPQDNFATTYYPGWLDFESADALTPNNNGDTIDADWGAVGKEIVERPSTPASYINGTVNTAIPFSADFIPMVSLLGSDGNLVANVPVGVDGKYSLPFWGNGTYEVFTSVPGFTSQSKYITTGSTKGDYNVDFNLEVSRGEAETNPVNTVANSFNLSQNYPNPFNPTTNISFTVSTLGNVKLIVYNSLGKEVTKLVNDLVAPGTYDIQFNGANLASGIYYYSLQVGNNIVTKKMNLVK